MDYPGLFRKSAYFHIQDGLFFTNQRENSPVTDIHRVTLSCESF